MLFIYVFFFFTGKLPMVGYLPQRKNQIYFNLFPLAVHTVNFNVAACISYKPI